MDSPFHIDDQLNFTTGSWTAKTSEAYQCPVVSDHAIDIGTKKVLVVLRVMMDALSKKEGPIRLGSTRRLSQKPVKVQSPKAD